MDRETCGERAGGDAGVEVRMRVKCYLCNKMVDTKIYFEHIRNCYVKREKLKDRDERLKLFMIVGVTEAESVMFEQKPGSTNVTIMLEKSDGQNLSVLVDAIRLKEAIERNFNYVGN